MRILKIEIYKEYNPDKKIRVNPIKEINNNLRNTDSMLRILKNLKSTIMDEYISLLEKRLNREIKDYKLDTTNFSLGELGNAFVVLSDYCDLINVITSYTCKQLALPSSYQFEIKEIMTTSLNYVKAGRRIRYHRLKAFIEILGENEGIKLWKKLISLRLIEIRNESNNSNEKEQKLTSAEASKLEIESWSNLGLADFVVAILDEHRVLYRFDKCLFHEAFKDFKDPDVAYLASCYFADSPEFNKGRYRKVRRTQTLHHEDYCDEFYWDKDVYCDPKQPPLEFTKKIGNVDPNELLDEYKELL